MRLGRWKYPFIAAVAVLGGLLVLAAIAVPFSADTLKAKVVEALAAKLDSTVELGDFNARVFPALHIDGTNLVIRHHGRTDVPPLISIKSFSVDAGLFPLLRRHITRVVLQGLDIRIPPDDRGGDAAAGSNDEAGGDDGTNGVVVDQLNATDGSLTILPDDPGVTPKVWAIHALSMRNVGAATRMPFHAALTNAVPPGEITTEGTFGPWNANVPGQTALNGHFRLDHANLAYFKGIFGTLSAQGTIGGWLNRIDINGETDTPDFGLASVGHPVPLHAKYHSIVDATNGNTLLQRVDASFLDTSLVASGGVVQTPGQDGRTVSVNVTIDDGRLDDLLRLAVKTPKPPLTGAIRLTTRMVLPPGDRDVVQKLELDGHFSVQRAQFASLDIQKKVDELSHRSRGKDADVKPARVLSGFGGTFKLRHADLALPSVQFSVPGATVRLAGDYGLRSERLNFRGTLLMAAKVSQTVGGFKHLLLKIVDPLFSRDGGGSAIPIKITGSRSAPDFGLDKSRLFSR